MQITLGINANHADSSACILIEKSLIAAIEEERINRVKHYSGFPVESIKKCIQISGIKENQITDIAFNTKPSSNLIQKTNFFLKNFNFYKNKSFLRLRSKINLKNTLKEHFNFKSNVNFHYVEHHLAHIASAFYPSSFNDACGLSIDGSGDFVTFAVAECTKKKINIKKKIFFPNSLGIFYHAMTQFLGFEHYGSEYKVMGMAAYGSPIFFEKIKKCLFIDDGKEYFKLNLKYFNHQSSNFRYKAGENLEIGKIYNNNLNELFKKDIAESENYNIFCNNFASSVQKIYEYYFNKILKIVSKNDLSNNLVYAGGCALNSSANRLLTSNNKYFDNIYIPFAPGDNGGALGAAFIAHNTCEFDLESLKKPYTGPEFSKLDIEKTLLSKAYTKKVKFKYIELESDLLKLAAEKISDGNVIGWFQDKMEFGPRALGNRSILADPRNPNMKDIINKKIKKRESFRPFAPAVLESLQNKWFETLYSSSYMSTVSLVKEDKRSLIPSVTHVDGTARLQSVNSKINPKFTNLINSFYQITGVPVLLNTSFNENEPIVMRPEEAIECLIRTDLDSLFINNFYITKI